MSPTGRAVIGLGFTQILGWGTTYYLPSTLGPAMAADLGLSQSAIWSGVTLLFAIRGILSPSIGAAMDRHGVRPFLLAAPPLFAAGLVSIALSDGSLLYSLGWVLIGLGAPLSLGPASFAAIAEIAGREARKPMTALTFVSGFTATLALPVTALLGSRIGWRNACLAYAAVQLFVSLPIQAWVVPRRAPRPPSAGPLQGQPPRSLKLRLLVPLGLAMGLDAWLMSGFLLHLVGLLQHMGASTGTAVLIASITGPAQVAARMADYWLGARTSPVRTGMIAGVLHFAGALALLGFGSDLPVALGFALLFGAGNGLTTIVHAAAPLALFGPERYGTAVGRLQLPKDAMNAASPVLLALLIEGQGAEAAILLILAISLGSIACLAVLASRSR